MNFSRPLILASKSPRRQQLLSEAGFQFDIRTKETAEDYPPALPAATVAKYLAEKKAKAFEEDITEEIVITADTIVKVDEQVLGKPSNEIEAIHMLQLLSNRSHEVITGVCLFGKHMCHSFDETTIVHFKPLTRREIDYYIKTCQPFDKAGAYGIQEWIGMTGITKIEGSYFNVVGLPVHRLYAELQTLGQ